MYKVGVVGPKRSVERIIYYVQQMKSDLTFIEFPYNIAHETIDILEKHHHEIDFWLFSGNIPYTIAQQSKHYSSERMQHINITINSYYRGIFELSHEIGQLAKNVSIDTLNILEPNYQMEIHQLEHFLDHLYVKHFDPKTAVDIVLKKDQRTGTLTRGIVKDILTNSSTHPHGIKVRLTDGQIGRVKVIHSKE